MTAASNPTSSKGSQVLQALGNKETRSRLIAVWKDERGQDLVEYALLTGFMVIAIWAVVPQEIVPSISGIFSRLISTASVLVP